MVIAAERVAGDECLRRLAEDRVACTRGRRTIVHARADDADRPGNEIGGSGAGRPVPCHIIHRAVPARGEPVEQSSLVDGEIRSGDADFLEAQRLTPAANVGGERRPIGLREFRWVLRRHPGKRTPRRRGPSHTDVDRHRLSARRAATEAAGARLARGLHGGMVVTLSGELGAGKTTLARGCLRALGWAGVRQEPQLRAG